MGAGVTPFGEGVNLAGGLNRYAYVGGNPVSYVDSMGLCDFSMLHDPRPSWNRAQCAAAGAVIGGVVGAAVGGAVSTPCAVAGPAYFACAAGTVPQGTAIGAGAGAAIGAMVCQGDGSDDDPDEDECSAEWDRAYQYCDSVFKNGVPPTHRNVSGRKYMQCVMGQVSERCGGNRVEH